MTDTSCHVTHVHADGDRTAIDLRLPAGAPTPSVAGDFTAWVPVPMEIDADGAFRMRIVVPRGTQLRYRVFLGEEDRQCRHRPLVHVTA